MDEVILQVRVNGEWETLAIKPTVAQAENLINTRWENARHYGECYRIQKYGVTVQKGCQDWDRGTAPIAIGHSGDSFPSAFTATGNAERPQ